MTQIGRGLVLAALLLLLWQGLRAGRAFWGEWRAFHPRRGAVAWPVDAAQLGLQEVSFQSRDGLLLKGWYVPSRTGAAIVLCHGSGADRRTMLDDARALAPGGAGLLLFDWPGHGESATARIEFGARERAALEGALDFLAARPDVDRRRIGALGTSMGGYLLVQAAATDARIRALVVEGTFGDAVEQTRSEYARAGRVPTWGALLAIKASGMDVGDQRPIDVVKGIAPRPLVVVTGSVDRVVPARLSRHLYEAAGAPKQLWLIAGAGHGDYAKVDETYGPRLRDFFARTLGATEAVVRDSAR